MTALDPCAGPAYIGLLVPLILGFSSPGSKFRSFTVRPFAVCARHHTIVQSVAMYRCSFTHGTPVSPSSSSSCCLALSPLCAPFHQTLFLPTLQNAFPRTLQTPFSRSAVTTRIRSVLSNWQSSVQLLFALFVRKAQTENYS